MMMKVLGNFPLLLALLMINACTSVVPIPELSHNQPIGNPLDAYVRVLQTYVNERGEVDFPKLQKQRTDLDTYVAYVAQLSASTISNPDARLAHYINSYNALSMYNVLACGLGKNSLLLFAGISHRR
jgi:hypothetical protein